MFKRIPFGDFGVWILLGMNIYLIWYYLKFPGSIDTIVWLFYTQSVLIGVFNVLDMLTLTHVVKTLAPKESEIFSKKGCSAGFFVVHYGMFHLVYLFFLPTIVKFTNVDWHFFLLSFYILLGSCTINFIQNKLRNRTEAVSIGAMFFMPYVRVLPIHLMILVPAFFHISAPLTFLVLKTVADVVMHVVYQKAVFKPIKQ